jgi:hypothetical protein
MDAHLALERLDLAGAGNYVLDSLAAPQRV